MPSNRLSGGRLPLLANLLPDGLSAAGGTLARLWGLNPKSDCIPRNVAIRLAVGVSPAVQSCTNFPCKAHRWPNAVRSPSASSLLASRIGTKRFHSVTAYAFGNQSGEAGRAVNGSTSIPAARSRHGWSVPERIFNDRGLIGLPIAVTPSWDFACVK